MIWRSRKSRTTGRWSINVTSAPNAAIKDAYSRTYHAGSHHDDFFRKSTQVGKVICVHNATIIKRNVWACAGCVPAAYRRQPGSYFQPL